MVMLESQRTPIKSLPNRLPIHLEVEDAGDMDMDMDMDMDTQIEDVGDMDEGDRDTEVWATECITQIAWKLSRVK
jgi:hypothetical protein